MSQAVPVETAPPAPTPEEVEQFLARGVEAQKAVDELLAKYFAPMGLKPTAGQMARFTAQLAEAERCEQRASELVGEINRLRAHAKQLRKAAPKILRELPQLELPMTAPEPIAPAPADPQPAAPAAMSCASDRVEGAASIEPGPGPSLPAAPGSPRSARPGPRDRCAAAAADADLQA